MVYSVQDLHVCSQLVLFYSGKLNNPEEIDTRSKATQTYAAYVKAAGGFLVSSLVLLVFILAQACCTFSSLWLSHWLEQGNGTKIDLVRE